MRAAASQAGFLQSRIGQVVTMLRRGDAENAEEDAEKKINARRCQADGMSGARSKRGPPGTDSRGGTGQAGGQAEG